MPVESPKLSICLSDHFSIRLYLVNYTTMDSLGEDLIRYLKDRNNRFKNSKGMEIGLTASNQLWTYLSLSNHNHGPLTISISTEDDAAGEFIDLYKLAFIQDINNLDYNNAWMRYLNGNAQIDVTPYELEATLSFRICKRKTVIYSLDLHYYDEAYEHLTLPEDFDRYIATHENRLLFAGENRYKMNRK